MNNNGDNNTSETIKAGDVDITINIEHHGGEGRQYQRPGGRYNTPVRPGPVFMPPPRKRISKDTVSIIVMCFCVLAIIACFWSYSSFTPSTHARKALAPGAAVETAGYYTDEAGWIDNESTLLKGLKEFYEDTGVHPYIYITKSAGGSRPTQQQLNDLYHELFADEAHLLVVLFVSDRGYTANFASGTQAQSVIDAEAESIIRDYIDYYRSFDSNTNSEALSKAFSTAAGQMMTNTLSPWAAVLIFLPTAAIVGFFYIRRRKKQREAKDELSAQEMEELLKIPLEKFGDIEAGELAKKYEDKN